MSVCCGGEGGGGREGERVCVVLGKRLPGWTFTTIFLLQLFEEGASGSRLANLLSFFSSLPPRKWFTSLRPEIYGENLRSHAPEKEGRGEEDCARWLSAATHPSPRFMPPPATPCQLTLLQPPPRGEMSGGGGGKGKETPIYWTWLHFY